MDLQKFQEINVRRGRAWHGGSLHQWTLLEWAGAMCGEAGEAANYAKKIRRLQQRLPNKEAGLDITDHARLHVGCAKEVADAIIYGLLLLAALDMDAVQVIADVFDQKSIEYGFAERAPRS